MITVGSLFSGCGGMDLGFENAGFNIKYQCDIDKWCRKILHKNWQHTIIVGDIHDMYERTVLENEVDILIGGFPCQPVSLAGRKNGVDDPRWLWPALDRAIRYIQPSYVVVENVPGLFTRGMGDVLGSLALCGYDAEWFSLRSSDIGAPHRRRRVFIIATNTDRLRYRQERRETLREQREIGRTENDNIFVCVGKSGIQTTEASNHNFARRDNSGKEKQIQFSESPYQTVTDIDSEYEQRSWREQRGWDESTDGYFGSYEPAVRRWERIFGPCPNPIDEKGRLSCEFSEWMMGFPQGWTEGVSRTQRLKMLGNSVQVQCAEVVAQIVKEKVKNE